MKKIGWPFPERVLLLLLKTRLLSNLNALFFRRKAKPAKLWAILAVATAAIFSCSLLIFTLIWEKVQPIIQLRRLPAEERILPLFLSLAVCFGRRKEDNTNYYRAGVFLLSHPSCQYHKPVSCQIAGSRYLCLASSLLISRLAGDFRSSCGRWGLFPCAGLAPNFFPDHLPRSRW